MNTLLDDWMEFRAGRSEFDTSHFTQLLLEHKDESSLRAALSGISGSEEVMERIMNVLAVYENGRGRASISLEPKGQLEHVLVSLAQKHLQQLRKVPAEAGDQELLEIIDAAKPVFSYNLAAFERIRVSDGPHAWLIEAVGDYLRDRLDGSKISYALMEAFYGLTRNFYLQAYVAEPMIAADIEFSNYFELWRLGGDHVLTSAELLVCSRLLVQ